MSPALRKLDAALAELRAASMLQKAEIAERALQDVRDAFAAQELEIENLRDRVGRLEAARSGGPAQREHAHHAEG